MPPPTTFLADLSQRGHFVCRSCLVSLRAAQRRPTTTRPPWTAATTTLPIRTLTRNQSTARGRSRRGEGTGRPASPITARRTPPALSSPPRAAPKTTELPTLEYLQKGVESDLDNYKLGRSDDDVRVRYFNQQEDGSIVPVNNPNAFDSEVETRLQELEGKLRDTEQLVQRLDKNAPARRRTDRVRRKYDMIREVEKELEEEEEEDGVAGADRQAPAHDIQIADTGLTANARRHVKNLNSVLRPAARRLEKTSKKAVDAKIITALWSRYGAARTGLAESWSNIPPAVWGCLWDVLAWNDPSGRVKNPRRMSHIYYLAKDMQAAGVALTDAQQLLAMEAMFIEGWPATALENWRRGAATLGARPATAVDYWELGVRMCALQGDLERAERAADHLFNGGLLGELSLVDAPVDVKKQGNPRVLFQVIRSAASNDAPDRAWETYRRLHDLLEADHDGGMKIEDYDEVVSCFLTANHTDYAFDVFVDMMFSGALDVRQRQYEQDKRSAPKLPSAVANHFFFGKWLKRLIGAGDLDGAYRVLKFMQSRGVMTAAVQVNGLLGAWLRSGTADYQARADALAWRMIESRRLFVHLRRREQQMDWPLKLRPVGQDKSGKDAADDSDELTMVPRASLETFLLMADNYKNRGQSAMMEQLWAAFRDCEMSSTDAFMMNQLLESYVHDGRADDARALYQQMVHGPQRVVPNANTFITLFRSLAVHRTMFRAMPDDERRAIGHECRQLVKDMTELSPVAFRNGSGTPSDKPVDPREAAFYQALGRIILHSFRKSGDYVALFVMVQVLRPLLSTADQYRVTRFRMTDSLAVELVAESSDLERDTPSARQRIFTASEVVDSLIKEARRGRLMVHGQQPRQDQGDGSSLDLSDDLSTVVARVYRIKCEGVTDEEFADMYETAVDELGVRHLVG